MEEKKYQIDFGFRKAYTEICGKIVGFEIFTDTKGLKIFTNKGVEYLTEENSEVL